MQFIIIRFKIFSLEKKRFFYPYRIIQASCSNGPLTTVDRVSEGRRILFLSGEFSFVDKFATRSNEVEYAG